MSHKPQLSLLEKLDLVPVIGSVLLTALGALVKAPFRGQNSPPTLFRYVIYHAVRKWLTRLSTRQLQFLEPSTTEGYAAFAKAKGFTPHSEELSDGTKGHWIGSAEAEKVVLYFHGGGFAGEANPFHFEICWEYNQMFKEAGKDVSFVMLAYNLAPDAQYPRQLTQSVAMLGHIINVLGRNPSNIMLMGDSSGAHLAVGVLSHLTHPHPEIPPLSLSANLAGAGLFSPWIELSVTAPSITRNAGRDMIPIPAQIKWSRDYLGGAPLDNYNNALRAPPDWWADLKVEDVLIVGGSNEVLVDDIKTFANKFTDGHKRTTTVIAPDEAHVSPVLDRLAGNKGPYKQDEAMRAWLTENF